uniref:Uncharacterized protein n=1 Tax=Spongospora subterranea TaxID=70186 RepID=A0A0H5R5B5_9EUKA|eukprot:CRZ09323.1 hypothetical protein [Spongospora subterranea]
MMSGKVAFVTGGNKGIGLAIVRGLAKRHPDWTVLLGSRNKQAGEEVVAGLKKEGLSNVNPVVVDVCDHGSIQNAKKTVEQKYKYVDVLVNNAGIAWKGDAFSEEVAAKTIATNYYGVLNVTNAFLPIMRKPGARIVNVSSTMSCNALSGCQKSLQDQFLDPNLTIDKLSKLLEQFIHDVKDTTWSEKGWPKSCYGVSKIGVSMLTRIMARDQDKSQILINCCCPGWVRTDMTGPQAHLTPDEGAVTPLLLCDLPDDQPTGKLWYQEKVRDWM